MKSTSKMFKGLIGGGLALLLVFALAGQALAQGTWETKAPVPTVKYWNFLSGGVIDGKLYVVGGSDVPATPDVLRIYDSATNTWTNGALMPTPRNTSGAAVIDGKFYVAGGALRGDGNSRSNVLTVYDPTLDTWTTLAPMPTTRCKPAAVAIGGKLYVVGGHGPTGYFTLGTLEVYDPAFGTWATLASMPTPREGLSAVAIDGKLYAVGGFLRPSFDTTGTLEVYDPATNTWDTANTPMPTGRELFAIGAINGQLHVAGGVSALGIHDTLEVYDPATDTWTTETPMPTGRWAVASGVITGQLYVAGGIETDVSVMTLEAYTPPVTECTPPPSGMVSWWDADSVSGTTAFDIQDGNDGTMTGGVVIAPGKVGNAFSFNGVDGFVSVPDSANQKPPSITIDGWFNLAQAPTPGTAFRAASKYGGAYNGWFFDIDSNLKVLFRLHRQPNIVIDAFPSVAIPVNTWVHIAGTYDGTTAHIYIDGILRGSSTPSGGYTPTSVPMKIGMASWFNGRFMPGLADEVEIFNRVLSATEIQAIFAAGSAGKCKDVIVEDCTNGIDDDGDGDVDCLDTDCNTKDADGDGYIASPCGADCDDSCAVCFPGGGKATSIDYNGDFVVPIGDVNVSATIVDADGNPVVGENVVFDLIAADTSTFATVNDTTDVSGNASGTILSVPTGVYTVNVSFDGDDCLLADSLTMAAIAVFDPTAGFVTGGGWIDSLAGADKNDPSATGKATFGFVAKYKKGANVPSGNTQFVFHHPNGLSFHSENYEWLVVTGGNHAQFKGTGAIDGSSGIFKFMLWAGDSSPDTFRIRLWEEDTFGNETDRYDNGFNQAIGGGSIVIHTPKGGK